jgi:hypothetical protein
LARARGPVTIARKPTLEEVINQQRRLCGFESAAATKPIPLGLSCRRPSCRNPPPRLRELNYVFFYEEPKIPGSGFGTGLANLVTALNTDFDWLREHTRYLRRAMEWDAGGRPTDRLLSGNDILEAKACPQRGACL